MSKELIEELNEQVLTYDEWAREKCIEKLAADRIEELERERDGWKASSENRLEIQRQREERIAALLSDNARLREALENIEMCGNRVSHEIATIALAATPKQSVDALKERIRAEAFAEAADKLEALRNRLNEVLSTKEPE